MIIDKLFMTLPPLVESVSSLYYRRFFDSLSRALRPGTQVVSIENQVRSVF